MQAGAMGLPAIVTNINGCNEIIIDGKNGYLIPVKNTSKLVSAMENFFNEKGIITKGSMCRQMIVNRYQQDIIWKELLNGYKIREAGVS
jgi:glycosyltransferase involved in cell wall biosynthesis